MGKTKKAMGCMSPRDRQTGGLSKPVQAAALGSSVAVTLLTTPMKVTFAVIRSFRRVGILEGCEYSVLLHGPAMLDQAMD